MFILSLAVSRSRFPLVVFVDVPAAPWHSRWMSRRFSVRRLVVALVLSQALALQAMLLGWGGALAVASGIGGGPAFICTGVLDGRSSGGREQPASPERHTDCLDVCLAGQALATVPDPGSLVAVPVGYAEVSIPADTPLLEAGESPAFSARAPPILV